MPIHDQSYRRYTGDRDARRAAPGRSSRRPASRPCSAKRKFLGLLVVAWLPFVVRAVQMYLAANFPQAVDHRARRPRPSASSSSSRACSCSSSRSSPAPGLIANDLRANALQIYLAKPMGRARVHRGQVRRAGVLPPARHLAAGHDAAGHPGRVRRQPEVPVGEPVPDPGHPVSRWLETVVLGAGDARALVAVEERALRRASCTPASLFFTHGALRRRPRA